MAYIVCQSLVADGTYTLEATYGPVVFREISSDTRHYFCCSVMLGGHISIDLLSSSYSSSIKHLLIYDENWTPLHYTYGKTFGLSTSVPSGKYYVLFCSTSKMSYTFLIQGIRPSARFLLEVSKNILSYDADIKIWKQL